MKGESTPGSAGGKLEGNSGSSGAGRTIGRSPPSRPFGKCSRIHAFAAAGSLSQTSRGTDANTTSCASPREPPRKRSSYHLIQTRQSWSFGSADWRSAQAAATHGGDPRDQSGASATAFLLNLSNDATSARISSQAATAASGRAGDAWAA